MSLSTLLRSLSALILSSLGAAGSYADLTVDIEGVRDPYLANVRALLGIARAADDKAVQLSDFSIARLHGRAEAEVRDALIPFGFYSPSVVGTLERVGKDWQARYVIDKGDATRIAAVDLVLEPALREKPEVTATLVRYGVEAGEILNHKAYSDLKQSLLRIAIAYGYLDASYERAEILVSPEARSASISLHLNSGPLYYFGSVTLNQTALDQDFAERFVSVAPGEEFSTERLVAVQFALNDSGYYQSVVVDASKDKAVDNRIPVIIDAESRNSQRYTARVGVGTDTGPRVRLGTEFRRLSSRGGTLQTDLQVSGIKSSATAQYSVPIKNVTTDRQTVYGGFDRAEIGDTDSDLYSIGARRYDRWRGLRRQLFAEFNEEVFALGSEPERRSELLVFGARLAYQNADDALFTRRGMSARFELHGAHSGVLSDTSFAQATLASRAIVPLGSRGRLLLRAELGATLVDDLSDLPPSQRFFTGGDRTVRGYSFEQLSPVDDEGASIGGRYLASASVEVDYFFNSNYGIAAFFDHGNAINSWGDSLESGYGLGFRYRTPVGVLRIDGARPGDRRDDTFRLHLSLGPDL